MRKTPSLSYSEKLLWRQVTKDVAAWKDLPALGNKPEPDADDRTTPDPQFLIKPRARPTYGRGAGIDRNTEDKLRRGKMAIDGKIDLHGFTQTEAYSALQNFILSHVRRQSRCLLLVTGKGRDGVGVLRQSVPRWLNEPDLAPYILSIQTARVQHGAEGAIYVLLRRNRSST